MVECPNCGHINSNRNKFCGECGTKLPNPLNYCPNCDIRLNHGEKFCTECGTKLVDEIKYKKALEKKNVEIKGTGSLIIRYLDELIYIFTDENDNTTTFTGNSIKDLKKTVQKQGIPWHTDEVRRLPNSERMRESGPQTQNELEEELKKVRDEINYYGTKKDAATVNELRMKEKRILQSIAQLKNR